MSADKYSLFYCLTESGWQPIESENSPTEGWVAIWEIAVYQGSPFGRTSSHPRRLKVNPAIGAEDLERLEQQFPVPDPSRISADELKRILDHALSSREAE